MKEETKVSSGFDELGIKDTILESIKKLGFSDPTPIQEKTIPVGLTGQDLIGIAQTGTGKTFAFGVPMLQQLGRLGGRGLVLLPTRELALQVQDSLKKLGTSLGLKTAAFIGGEPMEKQLYALRRNPHVIIATPGRLIDYLKRNFLNLNDIKVLVLDEADMMFDLGFAPQVEEILTKVPKERQTMLFSATMPNSVVKLAAEHLKLPIRIETAPSGTAAEKVDQEMYLLGRDDKIKQLEKILRDYRGSALIFVRTKFGVSNLTEKIREFGHSAEEIHSNLSLRQRRRSLDNFKSGHSRVLVATDIAARGLDVSGIELVVNYDLPDKLTDYVHRIGRTARAGKSGKAISFATPNQYKDIMGIEKIINQSIKLTKFVEAPKDRSYASKSTGKKSSRFNSRSGFDKKFRNNVRDNKKSFEKPEKKEDRSWGRKPLNNEKPKHLPKFNNKPDFGSFDFIEDRPVKKSFNRNFEKRESQAKPFSSKRDFSKRESQAKPFSPKHDFSARDSQSKPFSKTGFRDRKTGLSEAGRTSSYHSGKPFKSKNYKSAPSSYKSSSGEDSGKSGVKKIKNRPPKFKSKNNLRRPR